MILAYYVASGRAVAGTTFLRAHEGAGMGEFDNDHDESNVPDLADRDDVIWFLERNDIPLPDGLTADKIKSRGSWWAIDEESFSFRVERHPSGPFSAMSASGRKMPTPARWHVRKRYTYHLTTGEWDVTEQSREFHFDPGLLVDAEFEQIPRGDMWDEAITRAETADDPEAVLTEHLTAIEDMYRSAFVDIPEDPLDEMLGILEDEFRRRADMD